MTGCTARGSLPEVWASIGFSRETDRAVFGQVDRDDEAIVVRAIE